MTSTRPVASTGKAASSRLDQLTSLRFLAAFVVFTVHINYFLPLSWPLSHLAVGVSFFFVLSGFVLAWSSRESDTTVAFYRRRFARIYPVYVLAWLGGIALTVAEHGARDAKTLLATVLLLQAWVPHHEFYFRINLVAWSLSCEAFFYVCFPFILRALRRAGPRWRAGVAAGCVVTTCMAVPLVGEHLSSSTTSWFVDVFPLARLPEFVLGMVIGLAVRDGWRLPVPRVAAGALAIGALAASYAVPFAFSKVAVTLVPLALLIVAASTAELAGRRGLLITRPLVRLGDWSYAFYMIHTLWFRALALFVARPSSLVAGFGLALLVLAASVATSWAVYAWYEMPLERRLRRPWGLVPATKAPGTG